MLLNKLLGSSIIILAESKKIDFIDYLNSVNDFFYSLRKNLTKLYKQPSIFEAIPTAKDVDRAFQDYKKETLKALGTLENEVVAMFKKFSHDLEKGLIENRGINVDTANRIIKNINYHINGIQLYKDQLPALMNNLVKCTNDYADAFNKEVKTYPRSKDNKNKRVDILNKLK